MSASIEQKVDLITQMITTVGKLSNAEMRLRWDGKEAEADQIKAKHDEVREVIDQLRGQVADRWTLDAAEIETRIRQRNRKLQESIRNIQKKIKVAENVTKIIGQISEGITAVKNLVAP